MPGVEGNILRRRILLAAKGLVSRYTAGATFATRRTSLRAHQFGAGIDAVGSLGISRPGGPAGRHLQERARLAGHRREHNLLQL